MPLPKIAHQLGFRSEGGGNNMLNKWSACKTNHGCPGDLKMEQSVFFICLFMCFVSFSVTDLCCMGVEVANPFGFRQEMMG